MRKASRKSSACILTFPLLDCWHNFFLFVRATSLARLNHSLLGSDECAVHGPPGPPTRTEPSTRAVVPLRVSPQPCATHLDLDVVEGGRRPGRKFRRPLWFSARGKAWQAISLASLSHGGHQQTGTSEHAGAADSRGTLHSQLLTGRPAECLQCAQRQVKSCWPATNGA